MSILVQEPTRNEDQRIIYPQKPTILAQKRSFTPNFFEFQHFFVHRPLKTSNPCIKKFIYPLKRLILGIFSLQPLWNHCFAHNDRFEVSGLPRFARNDGFRVVGLLYFVRNDGVEVVGLPRFAQNDGVRVTGLLHFVRNDRVEIVGLPRFARNDREKGSDFCFFIRGKLLKITSIVNFQLISSNP